MNQLPDEILLIILSKLTKVDVLYSLMDVNERLNRIVRDSVFTRSIDLVKISSIYATEPLIQSMFDRLCLQVLPRTDQYVECLTLESSSIERVLHAGNYCNLRQLNLVDLDINQALYYFNDESPFLHIFKNQISHLIVTVIDDTDTVPLDDLTISVYDPIFSLFTKLTHLEFGRYNTDQHIPLILSHVPSNICRSSTIVYLNIRVLSFEDCLYLLDGRLEQLKTFIVTIDYFYPSLLHTIDNTKDLNNLKYFSLNSHISTCIYDSDIIPLLHRMSQLETLILSLIVYKRTRFIDGIHFNNEILSHMPYLHSFIFDIVNYVLNINEDQKSVDDIQSTFNQKIGCYIDLFPANEGRCHIYSLPFTMAHMQYITNNFPTDGLFSNVKILVVNDYMHPFEHEFFCRIAYSFPLLNRLTVYNTKEQKQKRTTQQTSSIIIKFLHLSQLDLDLAHMDYVEQFLVDSNTYLPCLTRLRVQYEHLRIVTENFTNDSTKINCAQLKRLMMQETLVHSQEFYLYFPLL